MPLASKPITPLHQSLIRLLHKSSAHRHFSFARPSSAHLGGHILGVRYFSCPPRTVRSQGDPRVARLDQFNRFIKTQRRGHMGHHHGHDHSHASHSHDTTLLTSKDTSNPGVRITRIGLYLPDPTRFVDDRLVNLALVFVKAAAGVLLHSSSLLADAGHSAADILSDILTLSTISFSAREPTLKYPLGFGKVETLGAIGVSSLLLLGGVGIGLSSLDALLQTLPPNTLPVLLEEMIHAGHAHGHGHSHGPAIGADPMALWVAGASIGVKEWLFRATKKIALEMNSTVLLANAWHHRTDALTSIVALAAIAGGQIYPFLDPVGGCLVSLLIIKVGYQSGKAACQEIVDRGLEPDVLDSVKEGAERGLMQWRKPGGRELRTTATGTATGGSAGTGDSGSGERGGSGTIGSGGIEGITVSDVRGTKSGAYYIVDVEVSVPGEMTVDTFDGIKKEVTEGVMEEVKSTKMVRVYVKSMGPK